MASDRSARRFRTFLVLRKNARKKGKRAALAEAGLIEDQENARTNLAKEF